jgi:hypothetical protein
MKKKKIKDCVYISGKITASDPKKQLANLRKFDEKEKELKDVWKEIFNPAKLETSEETPWEVYLARDLKWIYDNRPDMYFMKGWEQSKGARLEKQFAKLLGLNMFYEEPVESIKK